MIQENHLNLWKLLTFHKLVKKPLPDPSSRDLKKKVLLAGKKWIETQFLPFGGDNQIVEVKSITKRITNQGMQNSGAD